MRKKILMWLTGFMPAKAIDLHGQHYIERYHVLTLGKLTVLLHRYFSPDGDRHQHDHPHRLSLGIPLIGGYTDERLQALSPHGGLITTTRKIRPWRWNLMNWGSFHRVASVKPGTWTLFITWHRCKFWGFLERAVNGDGIIIYRPAHNETNPTPNNWYKTAPSGRALRHLRGTGTDKLRR